jgi:peptidoglycan-associated lipoprotein
MKRSFLFNILALAVVLSVGGMGCKHPNKGLTPIPGRTATPQNPQGNTPNLPPADPGLTTPDGKGISSTPIDINNQNALGDRGMYDGRPADREVLKAYTIHFDFDRATIKKDDLPKLEEVAKYLKGNAANDLAVEGHCDERGTEEYNRSLGERRALAAREHLMGLGIAANRVITKSFGEDKPAIEGHDEAAWSQNRRDEFIVLLPIK